MLTCDISSMQSGKRYWGKGHLVYLLKHGGIYVKRSAKFDEKAMGRKLRSQMDVGAPVSMQYRMAFPN